MEFLTPPLARACAAREHYSGELPTKPNRGASPHDPDTRRRPAQAVPRQPLAARRQHRTDRGAHRCRRQRLLRQSGQDERGGPCLDSLTPQVRQTGRDHDQLVRLAAAPGPDSSVRHLRGIRVERVGHRIQRLLCGIRVRRRGGIGRCSGIGAIAGIHALPGIHAFPGIRSVAGILRPVFTGIDAVG
jgi:hypothetical protein